jgi:Ser/Thr protein kinase RdoA (MazF antagonist)
MPLNKFLLDHQTIKDAFLAYGLKNVELQEVQNGYRNHSFPALTTGGIMVNLILYKAEPQILRKIKTANNVSDFLHASGLPARHTYDPRILKLKSDKVERYAAIYNYLPGDTIPWEGYMRAHLKTLGNTMARMHEVLNSMPHSSAPDIAEEYINIFKRMKLYFDDPHVRQAIKNKLGVEINANIFKRYFFILNICHKLPKKQMLHMDFVRGNILYAKKNNEIYISGILDFEKAGYGIVLLDIARTLAFLLVDCKYKSSTAVHKNFLIDGYTRSQNTDRFNNLVLKSGQKKISLLDELINIFMMHDFYKFLRHNPYEFLEQNEHYLRTSDYLTHQKVIEHAHSPALPKKC